MKTYKFTSIIWKEKEDYVSKCPELGVASCGSSIEEALENLKEAVELYIENARELRCHVGSDLETNTVSNYQCSIFQFRSGRACSANNADQGLPLQFSDVRAKLKHELFETAL